MFALALALSFSLAACGDDEKPKSQPVPDGSTDDDAATDDDASTEDDGSVPATGACTGAGDLATIGPIGEELAVYGEESDKTVAGVATDCAVAAFFGIENPDERPPAIKMCIDTNTSDGITADCNECYVATALCGISNCVASCAADANSEACTQCLCENNCISDFEECSGRPSDRCDGL